MKGLTSLVLPMIIALTAMLSQATASLQSILMIDCVQHLGLLSFIEEMS